MKETIENTQPNNSEESKIASQGRRRFLGNFGKAAIVTAAAATIGIEPLLNSAASVSAQELPNSAQESPGNSPRRNRARSFRRNAAQFDFEATDPNLQHTSNNDESLYPNKIGSYSKGLPHNANGEVNLAAFNLMVSALNSGEAADFDLIPLGGNRHLTSPQSGLAFDLEGGDGQSFVQRPAPAFASREEAAEIAENYWMAVLRDVPFADYNNNPIAGDAAADLTRFGNDFKGPKNNTGQVTTRTLFRGLTPGDLTGPYMSQFWYLPCFFGANEVSQRTRTVLGANNGGRDYMTTFSDWLTVQNGVSQPGDIFDPTARYLRNGRDLGQWVHIDVLFQGYFQAFLIMTASLGVPTNPGNPYNNSPNQAGFATFGGPYFAALLCEVAARALKAVWYQKWFVHRRLRPEAFAGRIYRVLNQGANYPVHPEILNSVTSNNRLGRYLPSSYGGLLPMAFPEGSPTHPAYGAGHATVAGACVTVLKALFNETTPINNPVVPSADGLSLVPYTGPGAGNLTVGGELNKIASNVAIGRNIAGVHWRSDATVSLTLGEAVAISILRDQRAAYNENFNGYTFTKFDGTTVTV